MSDIYWRYPDSPASTCSSADSSPSEMSVSPAPSPCQEPERDEEEAASMQPLSANVKAEPWSPESEGSWSAASVVPDNWSSAAPAESNRNWTSPAQAERRSGRSSAAVKPEPAWPPPAPSEAGGAALSPPPSAPASVEAGGRLDNAPSPLSAGATTTTAVYYPPNPYRRSDPYRPFSPTCAAQRTSRQRRAAADAADADPAQRRRFLRAVQRGDCEAVRQLLDAGARVGLNRMDAEGGTALHRAVRRGQLELVRLLVAHGANSQLADRDGWSPLHLATGHSHVLLYLLSLQR